MPKIFNIIVVDDKPETIEVVLQAVKSSLKIDYNYEINYKLLSKRTEVDQLNNYVCDIVMFDCALSGEDYNFQNMDESRYGFELIKKYREKNKCTKFNRKFS